jgi:hypothetical protein
LKNWHIIKNYSFEKNQIICVCDWFGDAGQAWLDHRKANKNDPMPAGFKKKDYEYAPRKYQLSRLNYD